MTTSTPSALSAADILNPVDPAALAGLIAEAAPAMDPADLAAIAAAAAQDLADLAGATPAAPAPSIPVIPDATPRARRPGGAMASRPLNVIFMLDTSSSMWDSYGPDEDDDDAGYGDNPWASRGGYQRGPSKIETLNRAMREAIPAMQAIAADNPEASVLVHCLSFNSGVRWLTPEPVAVEAVTWRDLEASGSTAMGRALSTVAQALDVTRMGQRALPPLVVMVSDGQPTDHFEAGLSDFRSQPWGVKAVKVAIAVPGADTGKLAQFTGDPSLVLEANRAKDLVEYIKWASTAALKAASAPASQAHGAAFVGVGNVPIPAPPVPGADYNIQAGDVW